MVNIGHLIDTDCRVPSKSFRRVSPLPTTTDYRVTTEDQSRRFQIAPRQEQSTLTLLAVIAQPLLFFFFSLLQLTLSICLYSNLHRTVESCRLFKAFFEGGSEFSILGPASLLELTFEVLPDFLSASFFPIPPFVGEPRTAVAFVQFLFEAGSRFSLSGSS